MITIIDYNMGNLGSMMNMFKRIGSEIDIQSDPLEIEKSKKLILPGVGAFDSAMNQINSIKNLKETLEDMVLTKKVPILGVCLGMQILTNKSEEGESSGLGWIPGKVKKFASKGDLKVPHMGWNIAKKNSNNLLTQNISENSRYYFVHSYYVNVENNEHSIMKTNYGVEFDSAINYNNIYGVQFHPEKSHKFGMQILKNFVTI